MASGTGQILVDPQRVREAANRVGQIRESANGNISQLNLAMDSLRVEWAGAAQTRFFEQYQQVQLSMTRYIEWLDHMKQDLETTANRFEEVERELSARILGKT
ncbi:MAG: WXG100 family type VII secretion target [Mycobacterium leprae]